MKLSRNRKVRDVLSIANPNENLLDISAAIEISVFDNPIKLIKKKIGKALLIIFTSFCELRKILIKK